MKKFLGTVFLIIILICLTVLSVYATSKKYEQVSGVKHIHKYSINANTQIEGEIELEFIDSNIDTLQAIINLNDENGLVWKGEDKVKDSSLGKYKIEILFYDTDVSELIYNELKLGTKKIGNNNLIESIRLFYPPDDSMVGLYFGCNSEPEVNFTKHNGKIRINLKSKQ